MDTEPESGKPVECRFLLSAGAPARAFQEALRADSIAAQLSPAFRVYYRLRSFIPSPVRHLLQRCRAVRHAPDWYLPREFHVALHDAIAKTGDAGVPTIYPWPDGHRFAFVPTHDVETADGWKSIERIAELETAFGIRSSWNIVPHKYLVDLGLLRDLQSRGFEVGVHGYNHDGKLFTSRAIFNDRLPAMNAALARFGVSGFRAPMVHRNLEWLQSLEIDHDGSYFDVDPYQAMPGGVGGVWPFIAGRFVELPYTMPQDHTLFVALHERDGRIWHEKLDYIAAMGGMALIVTHPDYLNTESRLDTYRRLLEHVKELENVWCTLPQNVANWWRERDKSELISEPDNTWRITGPAAHRASAGMLCATSAEPQASAQSLDTPPHSWRTLPRIEWRDLPLVRTVPKTDVAATLV